MIHLFSLIKSLYVRSGHKLRKCVSPLLMGAVPLFVLMFLADPIPIHGAESTFLTTKSVTATPYFDAYGEKYNAERNLTSGIFEIEYTKHPSFVDNDIKYQFESIVLELPYNFYSGRSGYYSDFKVTDIQLHLFVNGVEHVLNPQYMIGGNGLEGTWPNQKRVVRFVGEEYVNIFTNSYDNSNLSYIYGFISMYQMDALDQFYSDGTLYAFVPITGSLSFRYSIYTTSGSGVSTPDLNNATNSLIHDGNVEAENRWEEDRSDAESAGSEMSGFASQLDNLKNTWSILWYPIEFTNRFIQVFVGGTSAVAYQDEFAYTTGYRYNDDTGFLEPIMARSVQPASAGTGITFPAFSLMGYQIWDSYTYDLSQVQDQLPVVFDALYVIISILEMLWFVGYLRKKYEEVFG